MEEPTHSKPTRVFWSLRAEIAAVVFLLGLICCLAYPGMASPRLLDDNDQLDFIARFKGWKDCLGPDAFGLFRPVKNLVFYHAADWSLAGWHWFNLSTFLVAALAVYALLRRLTGDSRWGFAGALLWATCPTQVSAAVWFTCFNLNLAAAVGCLFLLVHDLARERSNHWPASIAAGLLLFLAQICYESAVALPLISVIVDVMRKRRVFTRESIVRYAAYGTITVGFLILRSQMGAMHSAQTTNYGFPPDTERWQLAVSAPWFFWRHLSMWLMPAGRLEFCSTYIWGVSAPMWVLAASWVFLLGFFALIVFLWKREPWISLGLLWFFAAGFPSANFVPIYSGPIEDYYLIIPSVGLAIALLGFARMLLGLCAGKRAERMPQFKMLCGGLLGLGIAWRVLGVPLFWLQAGLWQKPWELYLGYEATRPGQYQLLTIAARAILEQGNAEGAQKLADQSYSIAPWNPVNNTLLGAIALTREDYDRAISFFDQGMSLVAPKTPLYDFCRFRKAEALKARPATKHLTRETLLPLLDHPGGKFHLDSVLMLVELYLEENKTAQARNAVVRGLQHHPGDKALLAHLEAIDRGPAGR